MEDNSLDAEKKDQPPEDAGAGRLGRGLRASLVLTIILCILAVCQQFYGIGLTTRHDIQPERLQKADGYLRWKLPELYRTPLVEQRAVFFQNGERWTNRSRATRDLQSLGPGWYHINSGGINFIPLTPGDPANPAVRYQVVTPLQFKPRVGWILAGLLCAQLLLLNGLRARGFEWSAWSRFNGDSAQGWMGEAAVFAGTLIAALASLHLHPGFIDHAFVIKGIQESDALAWYEMGIGLSEGRGLQGGFQNQRPFYSVFLGGLFTLFGVKLSLAQGFNALCLALMAAGLYALGRLLHSRWTGLLLAGAVAASQLHLDMLHAILSENGGGALAVVSLLAAWQAAWGLSWRWAAAAGLLNGLAALTSGVTIFTLPLYALILVGFPMLRRVDWRRALQLGLVFTLAAAMMLGSWMVRQKLVNDRFTLSFNTAEVLAGGADLEQGRLSPALFQKAAKLGINLEDNNTRYDFFMGEFKRTLREQPGAYLRQVARAFVASLEDLPLGAAAVRTALLLGMLGFGLILALQRGQWLAVPLCGLLMLWWLQYGSEVPAWALLTAAAYLSWRGSRAPAARLAVLLLLSSVLATMLLAALSGNVATKRFWLVSDWAALALLLCAARHLTASCAALLHHLLAALRLPAWLRGTPHPEPARAAAMDPPVSIAALASVWAVLALFLSGVVLARQIRGPQEEFGPLDHLDAQAIATQGIPESGLPAETLRLVQSGKLSAQIALLGDLHAPFAANEGSQHWMAFYAQRPYPHWLAKFANLGLSGARTGNTKAAGLGSLEGVPRHSPLIVVGAPGSAPNRLSGQMERVLEVVRIIPLTRSAPGAPWRPDFANQIWFAPTPEALAVTASGSPQAKPGAR